MVSISAKSSNQLHTFPIESDDEEYYEITDRSSSASVIETGDGGDILSSAEGEDESEIVSDSARHTRNRISKTSFGALARAQDALTRDAQGTRKMKPSTDAAGAQEDKLQALRERLRELKDAKLIGARTPASKREQPVKMSRPTSWTREDRQNDQLEVDSESDERTHARSSKHAPAVQSSKRMVSRKRNVVEVKKPTFRDPRFDRVGGPKPDENVIGKRYSFLDDYRSSEMADLRAAIKKTKNNSERDLLKTKLTSMESQQKARETKEKQQAVVREHRGKEKDMVKQGKQPFYLKKSEQKKLALIDRFQSMKASQRDKVIERRRKRATAKERKNMPAERRPV